MYNTANGQCKTLYHLVDALVIFSCNNYKKISKNLIIKKENSQKEVISEAGS